MIKVLTYGCGFLGSTFFQALYKTEGYKFYAYDINPKNSKLYKNAQKLRENELDYLDFEPEFISKEFIKEVDLVVLSLPTPMIKETGECYTGLIEEGVKEIRQLNEDCWIMIKSTIPPGTTKKLNKLYGRIVHNPEFLTEANAFFDFINLPYQILGFPTAETLECPVEQLFDDAYKQGYIKAQQIFCVDSDLGEMVKYTRNCYLATRLSFFIEIKQICDAFNIDFDKMKWYAGLDERVGQHYNNIDENTWGGHCCPKDLNEIMFLQKQNNLKSMVLEGVWQKNLEHNKIRDWEQLEGRAVVSKDRAK